MMLNHEHYHDPTAGLALRNYRVVKIEPEYRRPKTGRIIATQMQIRQEKLKHKLMQHNFELMQRSAAVIKYGHKLRDIQAFLADAYVGQINKAELATLESIRQNITAMLDRYSTIVLGIAKKNGG